MTTEEAILTLKRYNYWRRGAEIRQPNPKEIGEAIDNVTGVKTPFEILMIEQKMDRKMKDVAERILSHQHEVISTPIRDQVVSVADIQRCFEEIGVNFESPF